MVQGDVQIRTAVTDKIEQSRTLKLKLYFWLARPKMALRDFCLGAIWVNLCNYNVSLFNKRKIVVAF